MKWLARHIRKWLDNSYNNSESKVVCASTHNLQSDPVFNLTVYNAVGGKVVEFRRYDRRTDKSDNTVYVISNEDKFEDRISKILVLESIR